MGSLSTSEFELGSTKDASAIVFSLSHPLQITLLLDLTHTRLCRLISTNWTELYRQTQSTWFNALEPRSRAYLRSDVSVLLRHSKPLLQVLGRRTGHVERRCNGHTVTDREQDIGRDWHRPRLDCCEHTREREVLATIGKQHTKIQGKRDMTSFFVCNLTRFSA